MPKGWDPNNFIGPISANASASPEMVIDALSPPWCRVEGSGGLGCTPLPKGWDPKSFIGPISANASASPEMVIDALSPPCVGVCVRERERQRESVCVALRW